MAEPQESDYTPPDRFATIVADPPWDYDRRDLASSRGFWTTSHDSRTGRKFNPKRVELPYEAMSVKEIAALPVSDLAARDAFLFLWTTNRYISDAFDVIERWGFTYAQTIIWAKSKDHCLPAAIAPIHAEFLLVAKRGKPKRTGTFPSSVIEAPRAKQHSAKPECFIDHIEASTPGPYLEMFARRARFGWHYWGNESLGTAEMAA